MFVTARSGGGTSGTKEIKAFLCLTWHEEALETSGQVVLTVAHS